MELVIITGMSGAGKSSAVNALEDIGFFCADNMPPELITTFVELLSKSDKKKVAFVTDARAGKNFDYIFHALKEITDLGYEYKFLFIDADDGVLVKRYKETRRRHPVMNEEIYSIEQAVKVERTLMKKAREKADVIFDTTGLSAIQCRVRIADMFSVAGEDSMSVHCVSFGYKYGIPKDADLVFDVRCLPNPFYIEELKLKTGFDSGVFDYVMSFDESKRLAEKIFDIIDFSLPLYRKEGRSQLVIAFGCTGGHHRSVTFARLMSEHLKENGYNISVSHRDALK